MKILCFSDVHLDAVTAGVPRFAEIARCMQKVEVAALEHGARFVVFCGDLCDPDSACAHHAAEVAMRLDRDLRHRGIAVRWLVGNHDVVENGDGSSTLSALRPVAYVWDEPAWETHGEVAFIALPFTPRSHAYDPAAFIEQCGKRIAGIARGRIVVFSHLNLEGIGPGSESAEMARGRDVFAPLAEIRKWWPGATIVNGHYHAPQVFDGVHVVGSLVRLRFDEAANSTGYLVLDV